MPVNPVNYLSADKTIRRFNINNRRRRGSETIEGALVTLIMFGLIFLIFDMSFSLYVTSTLQEAARDGVRFALTG